MAGDADSVLGDLPELPDEVWQRMLTRTFDAPADVELDALVPDERSTEVAEPGWEGAAETDAEDEPPTHQEPDPDDADERYRPAEDH